MDTAVVLFTRDLRVHDQPALAAAAREARRVVPLFVLDDALLAGPFGRSPNRLGFLRESLRDLDASLRRLGSALHVRRGDPVAETARVAAETGADAVHAGEDASAHAQARERRLAEAVRLRLHPTVTVHGLDDLKPYRVFTPYHRAWLGLPVRSPEAPPARLETPRLDPRLELLDGLGDRSRSPAVAPGGERAARERLDRWLADGLPGYARDRGGEDLGVEGTSRLSPYLHFGCVSAAECVARAGGRPGGDAWIRELCWRDFYAQLLRAEPHTARADLYDRFSERGGEGPELEAWREGRTGYPLVDAGLRQLRHEGWLPNRVRLVAASFLVKHLGIDWRHGADHFERLLLDGDVASNRGNWQWVAGTGVDRTQGGRMFNPTLQAKRRDPHGTYVRRWLPELARLEAPAVHEPWLHGDVPGYPAPVVDHAAAVARRRAHRTLF